MIRKSLFFLLDSTHTFYLCCVLLSRNPGKTGSLINLHRLLCVACHLTWLGRHRGGGGSGEVLAPCRGQLCRPVSGFRSPHELASAPLFMVQMMAATFAMLGTLRHWTCSCSSREAILQLLKDRHGRKRRTVGSFPIH